MKKLIFISLLLFPLALIAGGNSSRISFFINKGQAIPLGDYRSGSESKKLIEIAKPDKFFESIHVGMDCYVFRNFGVSLGVSDFRFATDKAAFEDMHKMDNESSDSYLRNQHENMMFYGGITSRYEFHKLKIEPRILLGYSTFKYEICDYYGKNAEGDIFRTVYYDIDPSSSPSYNFAVNINYDLLKLKGCVLGVQLFTEYSFQHAKIEYMATGSNKLTDYMSISFHDYKQNISSLYYGLGLILRL